MMNWLRRMMYGRNGVDPLSLAIVIAGTVVLILSQLVRLPLLSVLYWVCMFLFFYRAFSRNIYKRRAENMRYMTILRHFKDWWKLRLRMVREVRTHKYLQCPRCRQRLRVPRGKGKINISCSKCGEQFQRKV